MNMKSIAVVAASVLTAFVAVAKPTVSKVSATAEGKKFYVSYTLAEKNYNADESYRMVEVMLFESANAAKAYMKSLANDTYCDYEPLLELDVDEEAIGNGAHTLTYSLSNDLGVTLSEMKSEYSKAAVVVLVSDDSIYSEKWTDWNMYSTANVKYSTATTSVSARALEVYKKAQTLTGVYTSGEEDVTGTVTLKLGAINKKTGVVKVTATLTPFAGKKLSASANAVVGVSEEDDEYDDEDEGDASVAISVALPFKTPTGTMWLYADYDDEYAGFTFSGESEEGYYAYQASVGGVLDVEELSFVDGYSGDVYFGDEYDNLGISADGEPIYVKNGTKFSCAKAAAIKYQKYTEGSGADKETWYELVGMDDEVKTNLSGLTVSYTAKTGVFKGSYYLYASNECCIEKGAPKLKQSKVSFSGVVIDGQGFGTASVKVGKETYTWSVGIK